MTFKSASGNNTDGPGVQRNMDINRLLELVAAPIACLFLILIFCVFAVQRPVSTGILIPMMHTRAEPLATANLMDSPYFSVRTGNLQEVRDTTRFLAM